MLVRNEHFFNQYARYERKSTITYVVYILNILTYSITHKYVHIVSLGYHTR